eukprot:2290581-Pyramimonas_sp.AAC.1
MLESTAPSSSLFAGPRNYSLPRWGGCRVGRRPSEDPGACRSSVLWVPTPRINLTVARWRS